MRKTLAAGALCLLLLIAGCAATSSGGQKGRPPLPPGAPPNLAQATPAQFVEFVPVVNRYFYYRKQAVIARSPDLLWQQYPELKEGFDKGKGINAESQVVNGYRNFDLIDGNVQPESYDRLQVQLDGEKAILLVNGTELYLTREFGTSGGQVQLLLYLERREGAWTVVKTDETTLAEYHEALR